MLVAFLRNSVGSQTNGHGGKNGISLIATSTPISTMILIRSSNNSIKDERKNVLVNDFISRSYRSRIGLLSATATKVTMPFVGFMIFMMSSVALVEAFLFSLMRSTTSTSKEQQQYNFGRLQKRPQQIQIVLVPSFQTMPSSKSSSRTVMDNEALIPSNSTIATPRLFSSIDHRLSTLLLTIKNQRAQQIHKTSSLIRDSQLTSSSSNRLPSSCWAFLNIVQHNKETTTHAITNTTDVLIQQIAVQALRYAGDVNDYRYIGTLVDTLIQHYIDHPAQKRLDTRIFGEAIKSLSLTTTGPSKLRQMWKRMWKVSYGLEPITTRPPNAAELNTMITALGKQGKIIAALELYHTYTDHNNNCNQTTTQPDSDKHHYISPDSYTYSSLFDLLSNSIVSNTSTFISTNTNRSTTQGTSSVSDNPTSIYPSYLSTPFWQWKKVLQLLDSAAANKKGNHHSASSSLLNNFVYSAAVKVNENAVRIATLSHYYHDGATAALDILHHMELVGIVRPDVVTCTQVLAALEQGKQWKEAISLLETMKENTTLPLPNAYSYTCVISACAQSGKTKHALQLLEEVRDTHVNKNHCCYNTTPSSSNINTWVYNSALAAYNHKKRVKPSLMRKQADIIHSFLDRMESDAKNYGFPCKPDTATYNTALSCLSGILLRKTTSNMQMNQNSDENQYLLTTLQKLLSRMDKNNISRDGITYKTAILCCRASASSEELLQYALTLWEEALHNWLLPSHPTSISNKRYDTANSLSTMIKIANAVLEVCAHSTAPKSINVVLLIMNQMIQHEIPLESTTCLSTLLHSIGRNSSQYKMFPLWIEVLHGEDTTMSSSATLIRHHNLSSQLISSLRQRCPLQENHYASMLTWCIHHNDLKCCMKLLRKMKLNGVQPSDYTYESMVAAFSKSSIALSSRLNTSKTWNENIVSHKAIRDSTMSSAKTAKKLLSKIQTPSFDMLLKVCQACASAELWSESIAVLKQLHSTFFSIRKDTNRNSYSITRSLIKLHRSLLSICARHGNAKDAVTIVNLIQELERSVINLESVSSSFLCTEDYKLVIIAASKEKNWQICLQTLQTLRPYMEALRWNVSDAAGNSLNHRDRENLEFAFTSAVLCLEANGHYAWSIRVIHDWIEWSRTKPKKGALIAACRLIANADRGDQLLELLSYVRRFRTDADDEQSIHDINYFRDVYSQAIGYLHKNGDFVFADELYCTGVEEGSLPWAVVETATPKHTSIDAINYVSPLTLDLHGMTASVAKSAVRVALQRELFRMSSWLNSTSATEDGAKSEQRDIIIVTGRGAHSTDRFQPILRPQVQQMLTEEFYPPLSSSSLKGNMGALLIPSQDVNAWLLFHKQQRGVQMLALANIIRNISFGTRLVRSLRRLAN